MYVYEISVHDFCVKAFNLYAHFKHGGAKVTQVKIILLVLWFNMPLNKNLNQVMNKRKSAHLLRTTVTTWNKPSKNSGNWVLMVNT